MLVTCGISDRISSAWRCCRRTAQSLSVWDGREHTLVSHWLRERNKAKMPLASQMLAKSRRRRSARWRQDRCRITCLDEAVQQQTLEFQRRCQEAGRQCGRMATATGSRAAVIVATGHLSVFLNANEQVQRVDKAFEEEMDGEFKHVTGTAVSSQKRTGERQEQRTHFTCRLHRWRVRATWLLLCFFFTPDPNQM